MKPASKRGKNTAAISKREERQIVKDLRALGYRARKQPGSGNRDITLSDDVVWFDTNVCREVHIEDKYREKCLWKSLLKLKGGADILTLRQARGERMAFLPWALLLELVGEAMPEYPRVTEAGVIDCGNLPTEQLIENSKKLSRRWPSRKLRSRGFQKAGK